MSALILVGGLALVIALILWSARKYQRWRDQRDLRIRNERLARFCIIPQKGTRPTFSHSKED
jgi:hypothetical protein